MQEGQPDPKTLAQLFAKKAAVMSAVSSVEKDGEARTSGGSYRYVSSDAVMSTLRKEMAKAGLVLFVSMVSYEQSEITAKSGSIGYHTRATFHFTLACTETGATWMDQWTAEAIDYGDKSLGKVSTYAQKY